MYAVEQLEAETTAAEAEAEVAEAFAEEAAVEAAEAKVAEAAMEATAVEATEARAEATEARAEEAAVQAATMADLQAQFAEARAELVATSAYARARLVAKLEGPPVRQAATMADAIIDDMDDEDEHDVDFLPYDDEEGVFVRTNQGALLASFESLPEDADRHWVLAAEAQARGDAMAMRQAFVRSDLVAVAVAWAGPDQARIDWENCELQDAITGTEEAVAAAVRVRARYREDLARIAADEAAAQRARWDSSMAEVVERRRREDVASFREQNRLRRERRAAVQARMRSDDGAGPPGHAGGQ
ncbi:hypothetical protein ACQ4PT_049071 [Festuca glaucescens]